MGCPDGGTCHHFCTVLGDAPCWRVHNAGPLSGVYPNNRWPTELKEPTMAKSNRPAPAPHKVFVIGDRVKYVAPEATLGMIGARGTVVKVVGLYINVQWDGNKTVGTYFANDLTHLSTDTIDTTIDANAWLINQMATITKEHEELTSGLVRVDRYHREAAHNLITELARIGFTITKAQP